jgi:hypothetical protein
MPVIGRPGALRSGARGRRHSDERALCAAGQRVVDDVLARRNIVPCRRLIVSRASAPYAVRIGACLRPPERA